MAIEFLKKNIAREKELLRELSEIYNKIEYLEISASSGMPPDLRGKKLLEDSLKTSLSQLKIINNAIPDLVKSISFYKKIDEPETKADKLAKANLINTKYNDAMENNKEVDIAIKKEDQGKFLKNVSSYQTNIKKINKISSSSLGTIGRYISISNKFFRNSADRLVENGTFNYIKLDLRKITSPLIINTYLSLMLFTTLVSFVAAIMAGIVAILLGFNPIIAIALALIIPCLVYIMIIIYPSSKKRTLEREINQELPFLTIYMGAIATSGIEPSKIFNIVANSKDYPFVQRELKKLTNYINFYGYDLVNALRAVSKNNPSEKFSQLLDGLSTTITSGGELTEFLSKHSETLLFDYRLEREKYTRVTETLMNIYISVVIAAPMILMVLFVLMGVTSLSTTFTSPFMLGFLSVTAISLLNIGFLLFLNIKQPKF